MADTKKSNAPAKAVAKHVEIKSTEDLQNFSPEEIGQLLGNLEANEANEITAEYLKIEIGEEVKVFFIEMTTIKKLEGKDGETTEAVRLITESGARAINADVVIVSTCRGLKKPTPLLIQCTGEAGTKQKTYKTFKIIELK